MDPNKNQTPNPKRVSGIPTSGIPTSGIPSRLPTGQWKIEELNVVKSLFQCFFLLSERYKEIDVRSKPRANASSDGSRIGKPANTSTNINSSIKRSAIKYSSG